MRALEEENREMEEAARAHPELMKAVQANNRAVMSSSKKAEAIELKRKANHVKTGRGFTGSTERERQC